MSRYKNVYVDGKIRQEHRLVWEAAHGPIPDGYEIHHIDGNGHNNDLSNLQLLTRSEHASLHAKLREEGKDVVDTTDPEVIQHRSVTKRYCDTHKERRRVKNAEYRATHKEQEAARKKKYYDAHRDERLAYNKKYRDEHVEERRAYDTVHGKAYYAANKDRIKQKHAAYRQAHLAEEAARQSAYYESHKEAIAAYRVWYREIHRPWMYAKDNLRKARLRGASPERIAELEAKVEAARLLVEQRKKQQPK